MNDKQKEICKTIASGELKDADSKLPKSVAEMRRRDCQMTYAEAELFDALEELVGAFDLVSSFDYNASKCFGIGSAIDKAMAVLKKHGR